MSTTSTDPIADMLSRIRNAIAVNKNEISLPHSNVKASIAQLLKESRFLEDVEVSEENSRKSLKIIINQPRSNARITEITRMSTPGRRTYASADNIPQVKRGRGIVVISTNKGIMTGEQAKKLGVGGELICKVY